jgi:hypothetical protein
MKEDGKKVKSLFHITNLAIVCIIISGCSSKREPKEEQIRVDISSDSLLNDTTFFNSVKGNLSLSQIPSEPNTVVLTGMPQHRLVTVYKSKITPPRAKYDEYGYSRDNYESGESERYRHFMPGIDLIYGYNLLNIAHYDLTTEKLNFLFDHPVLVKSLYYPSFVQDSIDKKPVNRDYYLVSVYDADTNTDTLINKHDLRRFYYFNATASEKIQLLPPDYSVVRSQYDWKNDLMYVFANHDANKNGIVDKKEPLHIFWFSLKSPATAKRLY